MIIIIEALSKHVLKTINSLLQLERDERTSMSRREVITNETGDVFVLIVSYCGVHDKYIKYCQKSISFTVTEGV